MDLKSLVKNATDGASGLVKKELEKKELERQQAQRRAQHSHVTISVQPGSPLGRPGIADIYQRPEDGYVYFGNNESILYELIEYSWNGPIYSTVSTSNTTGTENSQTIKKGKSGRMAAGALVGTLLFPGVGTVVGAAVGAGGKGKSSTTSNQSRNTNQTIRQVEQNSVAVLKFRRVYDGAILPATIACNTQIDAQIRCLRIRPMQTISSSSKEATDSLKGIKALKELLDVGAITKEEFEFKKKQLLNL